MSSFLTASYNIVVYSTPGITHLSKMKTSVPASALFMASAILVCASIHVVSASKPALLRGSTPSKLPKHLKSLRESRDELTFVREEEEGQEGCKNYGTCPNCDCSCCDSCVIPTKDGTVEVSEAYCTISTWSSSD